MKRFVYLAALPIALALAAAAHAEDPVLTLENHRFSPDPLTLTAGQKVILVVRNRQEVPAEFESSDLDREKLVAAHGEMTVILRPLDPGRYRYFDDFHRETTGTIVVK